MPIKKQIYNQLFIAQGNPRRLFEIFILFTSKTGGVVVGVVFLPIYYKLLGADAFGSLSVILSLLAFVMVADFGMGTLVARDVAYHQGCNSALQTLRHAEITISIIYSVIILISLFVFTIVDDLTFNINTVVAAIVLYLLSILHNLEHIALIARKKHIGASSIQIMGVIFRAILTLVALKNISATVQTFIYSQIIGITIHLLIVHYWSRKNWPISKDSTQYYQNNSIRKLIKRGSPLLITGIAGAAVMQLDKPIVSFFMSPEELSPYYLAMTFSALPTTLLAAPIVQYFQPQIIQAIKINNQVEINITIKRFTTILLTLIIIPSSIAWHFSYQIITLWLDNRILAEAVNVHTKILLPAFTLGSLSYVPVVILLAVQDYEYQAKSSVTLMFITLSVVIYSATQYNIDLLPWSYMLYFFLASISVWTRSLHLEATNAFARVSARNSLIPIGILPILFLVHTLQR